jgi:hypothetical protein
MKQHVSPPSALAFLLVNVLSVVVPKSVVNLTAFFQNWLKIKHSL